MNRLTIMVKRSEQATNESQVQRQFDGRPGISLLFSPGIRMSEFDG